MAVTSGGDGTVKLFNAQSGKNLLTLRAYNPPDSASTPTHVAFSPDGNRLAICRLGKVQIRDAHNGNELLIFGGPLTSSSLFSQDWKTAITFGGNFAAQVWDVSKGADLVTLRGDTQTSVSAAAFSTSQRTLATGNSDGTARVWRATDGTVVHTFRGHSQPIPELAISETVSG